MLISRIKEIAITGVQHSTGDINLGLIAIINGLGDYNGYCILQEGIRVNGILYKWNKIKSWKFENNTKNKILLELDKRNIKFNIHEKYNERVEELLNEHIVQS